MSEQRIKNTKVELKSNKEEPSEFSKNIKRLLSFDLYFQKLTNEGKALPHHKAAMLNYADQNGLVEASEDEFEKLFKSY